MRKEASRSFPLNATEHSCLRAADGWKGELQPATDMGD